MELCWSPRSTSTRFASVWAAPDPVNPCLAQLARPVPGRDLLRCGRGHARLVHAACLVFRLHGRDGGPWAHPWLACDPRMFSPLPWATPKLPLVPAPTARRPDTRPNLRTMARTFPPSSARTSPTPNCVQCPWATSPRYVDRFALSQKIYRAQTQLCLCGGCLSETSRQHHCGNPEAQCSAKSSQLATGGPSGLSVCVPFSWAVSFSEACARVCFQLFCALSNGPPPCPALSPSDGWRLSCLPWPPWTTPSHVVFKRARGPDRLHGACSSPRAPSFSSAQGRSQPSSRFHVAQSALPHKPFRQELSRGPAWSFGLFLPPVLFLGLCHQPCRVAERGRRGS